VGQADGLLGKERLIRSGRIEVVIAEAVVDGVQARAAGVTGEGRLHRGWLPREGKEPIAGHVQSQIHEDVDLVFPDLGRELLVTPSPSNSPWSHITGATASVSKADQHLELSSGARR